MGAHRFVDDELRYAYWTSPSADEISYPGLEVSATLGATGCINSLGDFAVVTGEREAPTISLGSVGGSDRGSFAIPDGMAGPTLRSMNRHMEMVGSIETNHDVTDGSRQKPAAWTSDGRINILRDLQGGESGQAIAINDAGIALVFAHYGWFGRIGLIWDLASNSVTRLPGNIIPVDLAAQGQVVGVDRTDERNVPVLFDGGNSWTQTATNNGFFPHASNDDLALAGSVEIGGYSVPWVMRNRGVPQLLPTLQYHSVSIRSIDDDMTIVGMLTANEESHVVIWRPISR